MNGTRFSFEPPDDDDELPPDSERTQRADYELDELDRQRDDALIDRLREERLRLEALLAEPDSEVPF